MKRIALLLAAILALAAAIASVALAGAGPSISFSTKLHDFGTVGQNDGPVKMQFDFTNTGEAPLVIISANASCGCTKPIFPDAPIAPGESSAITVEFNPKHQIGEINKTVTIRTNDSHNKKVTLRFSGIVKQ